MMRLGRFAAALSVAAIVLAGCNDGDLPPGTQFSPISGFVMDAATQQPLAGATVVVDSVLTAVTDTNGKFVIERAPSGIVDYSVQAPGHTPISASANAPPGKGLAITVSLTPAPGASPAPSPLSSSAP